MTNSIITEYLKKVCKHLLYIQMYTFPFITIDIGPKIKIMYTSNKKKSLIFRFKPTIESS